MTAIIDGVTVIGTPSEIDSLLRIRERKTNTQWDDRLKELMSQHPIQKVPLSPLYGHGSENALARNP